MRSVLNFTFLLVFIVNPEIYSTEAFSGGGFGGGAKSSVKQNPRRKKRNKKKSLAEVVDYSSTQEANDNTQESEITLDRWGLPPPTIHDIFPPLAPSTEIKPAQKEEYTLQEIQEFLQDYIDLCLDETFDEFGVEKLKREDREPMKLKVLHESPPVLRIENFLTPSECQDIQATVNDPHACVSVASQTFPGALSQRTSTSWFSHYDSLPTFLAHTHHSLHIPLDWMEEPQIVRYATGQEFTWHYDAVPPASKQRTNSDGTEKTNQRLMTLLVYLNSLDDRDGGATEFRDLQDSHGERLAMAPTQGHALLFFPATRDGRPDERTLHRGQPVKANRASKWIVQLWTHQREYHAVMPPGNLQAAAVEPIRMAAERLGYR